jgi:hypothetical protein
VYLVHGVAKLHTGAGALLHHPPGQCLLHAGMLPTLLATNTRREENCMPAPGPDILDPSTEWSTAQPLMLGGRLTICDDETGNGKQTASDKH